MASSPKPCVVCSKPNNFFNYGVYSCNGCVLFFRRMMTGMDIKRVCKSGGNCSDRQILKCKQCRFIKCLEVGMSNGSSINAISPVTFQTNDPLSLVIKELVNMDSRRNRLFLKFEALNDPTFDELMENPNSVKFLEKLPNRKLTIFEWGFCQQVTTIEFLRKLDMCRSLEAADLKMLIRASFFKTSILNSAFQSYCAKKEKMVFPDGSDVMPEELHAVCPELLNQIRCRLIGKFIELRITSEEFLLLIALFLTTNPAVHSMSENGKTIVETNKKTLTKALFDYCQVNYGKGGPSRFSDLIAVCHVINKTLEDFCHLAALTMCHGSVTLPKKLFEAN